MQVKIYTADTSSALESSINSFISSRNVLDIKFQTYVNNNQAKYKAMIIYGTEDEVAKKVVCCDTCG